MKRVKRPYLALVLLGLALAVFLLVSTEVVKARPLLRKLPDILFQQKAGRESNPAVAGWAQVEADARKEGRLTLYSWSWTQTTAAAVLDAFWRRYGIRVEVVAGRGPQFLQMLQAELRTGLRIGDVVEGAQTHLRNMKLAGLTTSALELPALRDKGNWVYDPTVIDRSGYVLSYAPYLLSPYVNTNLVSAKEQPSTFAHLLEPRWKGRMVMPHPETSTVPYYLSLLIRHKALPPDYIVRLARQDILLSGQNPDSGELLGWGRAALSVLNAAPDMVVPWRQGAPLKAVAMPEGLLLSYLTISLVKDSPHPNAARLFINWLLTEEGQTAHSTAKLTASVRRGIPDSTIPAFRLKPAKLIPLAEADGEFIAREFREKSLVPLFPPGSK